MRLIPSLKTFMDNKIFSYDIFFLVGKTPYPLLSISYPNYVEQYLQTIRITNLANKMHGVLIHHIQDLGRKTTL